MPEEPFAIALLFEHAQPGLQQVDDRQDAEQSGRILRGDDREAPVARPGQPLGRRAAGLLRVGRRRRRIDQIVSDDRAGAERVGMTSQCSSKLDWVTIPRNWPFFPRTG